MSLPELQSWLVQEGLRDELDELTCQTVRTELDNDEITGLEAELFAAIKMAEQQTKEAQEQRRAAETALVHPQQAIKRMDAARTVFSAQVDELVRNVRQQVQQSVSQVETAAHNIKRKVSSSRDGASWPLHLLSVC